MWSTLFGSASELVAEVASSVSSELALWGAIGLVVGALLALVFRCVSKAREPSPAPVSQHAGAAVGRWGDPAVASKALRATRLRATSVALPSLLEDGGDSVIETDEPPTLTLSQRSISLSTLTVKLGDKGVALLVRLCCYEVSGNADRLVARLVTVANSWET
jgi:hypothetical protein